MRAAEELVVNDTVSIVISDVRKTGVSLPQLVTEASFPGGPDSLNSFIENHLTYPDTVSDLCAEGSVPVEFKIDTTGKYYDLYFLKTTLDTAYKEEGRRVLNVMPHWIPATSHGKKFIDRQEITFTFQSPYQIQCGDIKAEEQDY